MHGVLTVHALFLAALFFHAKEDKLYLPKKVMVHTYQLPKATVSVRPTVAKPKKQPPIKQVSKQKQLLDEVKRKLSDIQKPTPVLSPPKPLAIPPPLDLPARLPEMLIYQDLLIDILRDSLTLPAYGKVTVKLTLWHSGVVKEIRTVAKESEENEKFLLDTLQTMQFPEFQGDLKTADEQTFLLTFCGREPL